MRSEMTSSILTFSRTAVMSSSRIRPATPGVYGGLPTVPEEKLTDFVRDLDQKYYDATIARANELAGEVKAIFTDLQFTGLMRRYGTW